MAPEDKRVAIGFSVTLSSQLMAASLGILAIEAAYIAYALAERDVRSGFVLLGVLAGICFAASIFCGGKAVTAARNAGFEGSWSLDAGKRQFNGQALSLLLALLLFAGMLVQSGSARKQPQLDRTLADQAQHLDSIDASIAHLKHIQQELMDSIVTLRGAIMTPHSAVDSTEDGG